LLFFFRKPIRKSDGKLLVSPCDGTVVYADNKKISIFLSIFDVHWQYVPINSVIKKIERIRGKYNMAFLPESDHNEGVKVTFGSKIGDIVVTQRVGFLARRIENNINVSDNVFQSEPYGIIKFGSRVDIILPDNVECILNKGDKVRGGETQLIK
jgi:phosphatidylserine decarboxylase